MVIGLIAAGAWISLTIIAVALCRMAGHADDVMASSFPGREVHRAEPRRRAPARAAASAAPRESGARIVLFPH